MWRALTEMAKGCLHRLPSYLYQEFLLLWVLWLSGHLGNNQVKGSLGQRSISNFPPHPMLLPSFLWKQMGDLEVMGDIHLAWKPVAYSSYVSMETDVGRATHRVLNKFTSLYSCSEKKTKIQSYSRHFLKTSGLFIKLVQIPSHSIHFEIKRHQNIQAEVSAKDLGPGCSVGCTQAAWCPKGFDAEGHIADDGSSQLAPDRGTGLCHSLSSMWSWMAGWVPSEM